MKTTRKLLAFVMVIAMVMAMAVAASAATITLPTGTEYTYEVFQMATYETPGSGNNGYKVNEKWLPIASQVFNLDTNGYIIGWKAGETETTFVTKLQTWLADNSNYASVAATKVSDPANVAPGYYVMASIKDGDSLEKVAAGTITASDGNITMTEKNGTSTGLPQITKKMTPSGASYVVGEERQFEVVVTTDAGDTKYTITDTMSGLELVGSVTVVCSDSKAKAPVVTTTATGFEVVVEYNGTSSSYETITITYTAKVTEAGVDSITNAVEVKDQDGNGPGESTVTDANSSFTLTKTDGSTQIEGAKFALYAGGTKVNVKGIDTDSNGVIDYYRPVGVGETADDPIVAGHAVIKGLATGTDYALQETEAPAGYEAITGDAATFKAGTNVEATVVNKLIDPLPETGGMGTTLFYTLGSLMVVAAAVLLVTKKRMEVK